MNFIFISPHYPHTYWQFCDRLARAGVNVLGIGDTPYFNLTDPLKNALTEYYYLDSLKDYDQVYRAVAFFAFKYGRVDWIESNNAYWLGLDAHLREDFHVVTGAMPEEAGAWKEPDYVRRRCRKANVPCAVGEEIGGGRLCSYNAITNADGEPLFEGMTFSPDMDSCCVSPEMPEALREMGRAALEKAFHVPSRFANLRFLRRGPEDYALVKADMSPGAGWLPDLINFAYSTDAYEIWAEMVSAGKRILPASTERHWCAGARRRDRHGWLHSHGEVLSRFGGKIAMYEVLRDGAECSYALHAYSEDEAKDFIAYVHAKE